MPNVGYTRDEELRETMHDSVVHGGNLDVAHSDGAVTRVASRVWCKAPVLPHLSGMRKDKVYANDVGSDRDAHRHESPARHARSESFRVAFCRLVSTLNADIADSTIFHKGNMSITYKSTRRQIEGAILRAGRRPR